MLRVHKKVEYALIAMKYLSSKSGTLCTAKEVSENTKIPLETLSRVMQSLAQKSYLLSEQGVKGGYRFSPEMDAEKNLFQLIEDIEGPQALVKCLKDNDCPLVSHCNMISPMSRLDEAMKSFLKQQSLLDLIRQDPEELKGAAL